MEKLIRITLAVFLLVYSYTSYGNTQSEIIPNEEQINKAPWKSYQALVEASHPNLIIGEEKKLIILLKRAYTENILYFYNQFSSTVEELNALVKTETPLQIRAVITLFSAIEKQRKAEYRASILLFKEAMKQAEAAKDFRVFVFAKQELAYTRGIIEEYETSLIELQEAYLKAYSMDDQFLLALINETYGVIYGYMGEYEKSAQYHEKALSTFRILGYKAYISDSMYGLATTYRYWKKYDLAIKYFEAYREILGGYTPNSETKYYSAYGLGMTLAEKGDCDKAFVVIQEALSYKGLEDYDAELFKKNARCFISQGNATQAKKFIDKADSILSAIPSLVDTKWHIEILLLKSDLASLNGENKLALEYREDYYKKYINIIEKNSSQRLIQAKAAMELERQNVENALSAEQNKIQGLIQQQENQKRSYQSYIIASIVFTLILIVFGLLWQLRNHKKILALSIRDPLSGLYNRRYIFDYINRFINHSSSEKLNLQLIMIDIDDFKQLNDTYGHPFGDQIIRSVARVSIKALRTEDVMGRVGGEEFLCVLPRVDSLQANAVAQRIRESISEQIFETDCGKKVSITVSIGLAGMSPQSSNADELYANADKAMYYSKGKGKNKVTVYEDIYG